MQTQSKALRRVGIFAVFVCLINPQMEYKPAMNSKTLGRAADRPDMNQHRPKQRRSAGTAKQTWKTLGPKMARGVVADWSRTAERAPTTRE